VTLSIDHIAIWVSDLEQMKLFYSHYFGLIPGRRYENKAKMFTSYFLSSPTGGARLELMHQTDVNNPGTDPQVKLGLAHLAISVGSKEKVNELTNILRKGGSTIVGEPRTTGDGYYESVILDPEDNVIEITT
jgi:lactoylglutathione lyase